MTRKLNDWFEALYRREDGQTLVEYALIILLVSVALVGALGILAGDIGDLIQSVSDSPAFSS